MISSFISRTAIPALLRPKPPPSLAGPCPSRLSCRNASNTPGTRPKNQDIQYSVVQVVDPETGRLNPPIALRDILSTMDPKTHFVELVSENPAPIVKLISKKEAFDKYKALKARLKAAKPIDQKEIQLTWGVASGDLTHKLKKVRVELERGNRVDLVYAPKKGHPVPGPKEIQLRVQETVDMMADVGKEWKPREIERSVVVIHFQGKTKQS